MVYIIMNNGCYGLTKGQDSATADFGSVNKSGEETALPAFDIASIALEMGATYVARSFSGDKAQLVPLIKGALSHNGFALIDVISPCVTFNNTSRSTKSYDYVRQHIEATSTLDFVPKEKEIEVDYEEGGVVDVKMHDGSKIHLSKLAGDWDPKDKNSALTKLQNSKMKGEILTGLIYVGQKNRDLHKVLNTVHKPLNTLTQKELCPGSNVLDEINLLFR